MSITAGQTSLLVSDAITRLKHKDADYFKGTPDFLTPFAIILPKYAVDNQAAGGTYYFTPSQASAPTAFPSAQSSLANGNVYEISLPTDCINNGIKELLIKYATNTPVPEADITQAAEASWDVSATNTTIVYYEQAGRKVRIYLPTAYVTTPFYAFGYTRYPTIPTATSDGIDVPAEDIDNFLSLWESKVLKD